MKKKHKHYMDVQKNIWQEHKRIWICKVCGKRELEHFGKFRWLKKDEKF